MPTAPFLDWLRFTLPYDYVSFQFIDERLGGRIPRKGGLLSYSTSELLGFGGLCAYSPEKKTNRILVDLSARALRTQSGNPAVLIGDALNMGATVTRIDVAIDEREELVRLNLIWRKLCKHECLTRFRSYSRIQSRSYMKAGAGYTVYVGDRSSEAFVRFYDKAAESGEKGHWVRMEFEFKKHRAHELAGRLARGSVDLAALMLYYIDFKDPQNGKRVSRWPTSKFWKTFTGVTKDRLYFPRYDKGLEEVKEWFVSQVSPAAVLLLRTEGIESFEKILDAADPRFEENKRYRQIEKMYYARPPDDAGVFLEKVRPVPVWSMDESGGKNASDYLPKTHS